MRESCSGNQGITTRVADWGRHVLAVGVGLFVLASLSANLGNLSRTLNGLLVVGGLLLLALFLPLRADRLTGWRLALVLGGMAGVLLVVARGGPLALLASALFFFGLSLLTETEDGTATALLLTTLFFALYRILVAYVPAVWYVEQWVAIYSSWLSGVGLMLGPTALGLPLFFLFLFQALSVLLLSSRRRAFLLFLVWSLGFALAVVGYVWLQPPLGSLLLTLWPAPPVTPSALPSSLPSLTYLESTSLLFLLLWLISALAAWWLRPGGLCLVTPPGNRRWLGAGLALLALAALGLTLDPPTRPSRGTVLFYDVGHLEWGKPAFGRYGANSGGAFGLVPDYLAAYGYQTRIGLLAEGSLHQVDAVVLVNLPEMLTSQEKGQLLAFVEQGGGLIIWGEHTGLGRIREPVNDLLADLPMRLKFDSAVPTRQGWVEGLVLFPHPIVYGVQDPSDLVIAVGASLQIEPPAVPVIVGRFGHSDRGNAANQARNYVGDMRYNPGERLGDLVLAAEVEYGQGRIVVLGDTTPLGSVNLMTTAPVHARLLDWVTGRPSRGWGFVTRNSWLVALFAGLLLAGAVYCLWRGKSRVALAGAALVLGVVLALTGYWNEARSAPPLPTGSVTYVDISHQERFDRLLWEETSIGGLAYNLARNGTLPFLLRDMDGEALAEAELLVLIAPGDRFSAREVRIIVDWVERGGKLLVSVGWEESEASEGVLAPFGLSVGNIPLGPVEVGHEAGLVRFHEAWPVEAEGSTAQTIIEGYGYPLAIYQPWGEGGVVLLGDSAFLLGSTLEAQNSFQEGNILLLREILQEYLDVGGQP